MGEARRGERYRDDNGVRDMMNERMDFVTVVLYIFMIIVMTWSLAAVWL